MKRIVATFITVLFFAISIFATEVNLKGIIVDSNGTLFKITITPIDTTKIAINGAVYKKDFEFPIPFTGDAVIEIESDNNESYSSTITILATGYNLGEIKLRKLGVKLKEVTVTGRKMQIERDGLDYIIRNIQGTHLGDAGNLMDMLKWTPGVIVRMDDDISVIGKGSPAIYINDRKIMDKSELLSLQSSEVSRIEVIREPGVRYSTGTSSVIHIYLRKPLKDYIGASLSNNTNIYRKVSNVTALNLNGKFGIVSATVSFRYSRANGFAYDHSSTTITHSGSNIFHNKSDGSFSRVGNRYNIFGGMNFMFTPKSVFTIQYSGNISDGSGDTDRTQNITDNKKEYNKLNQSQSISGNNMHSMSANYILTRNKDSKLSLGADYATRSNTNSNYMIEKNLTTGVDYSTLINTKSDYNIYTFNGNYSFKIGKEDDESVGIEMGHVKTFTDLSINAIPQSTDRRNMWFAAFGNFHRWWGKFNVSIGLRFEYDNTDTRIIDKGTPNGLKKEYSNIFPNVRVSYMPKKGRVFAFSYRRIIVRPSFGQLTPIVNYEDSLHYSSGNPLLKPTFADKILFTANFLKDITLSAEYIYRANTIVGIQTHDNINPNILYSQPENIDHSHGWSVSADYTYTSNRINLSAFAIIEGSYIKYPYMNEIKSYNKIAAFLMSNFAYNFYKDYDFYMSAYYQSPWMDGNKEIGYTLGVNCGVSAKFLDKKLYISVDVNDIFRKSVTPYWESHTYDTDYWRKNEYDTRGVELKIRYTFNSIRTNFKHKSGNEDLLNRTND